MKFNAQNVLKTSRFTLKVVTSACKVFDAGYYTEDAGLNINEVRLIHLKDILIQLFTPSFSLQVIFNTLKVESEATSPSAPTASYKPNTNYFVLNPKANNRSIANLRSLKPPVMGPNGVFFMPNINNGTRAAVMDRGYENEPEDSEDDALNVTFTSLAGDISLKPKIEYATSNSRSPSGTDRMATIITGEDNESESVCLCEGREPVDQLIARRLLQTLVHHNDTTGHSSLAT